MTRAPTHPAPPPDPDASARATWLAGTSGERARLLVRWPITDDTLPPGKLRAEARRKLADHLEHWNATLVEVLWSEAVVEDGPELHAIAQVVVPGVAWNAAGRLEWLEPEAAA